MLWRGATKGRTLGFDLKFDGYLDSRGTRFARRVGCIVCGVRGGRAVLCACALVKHNCLIVVRVALGLRDGGSAFLHLLSFPGIAFPMVMR